MSRSTRSYAQLCIISTYISSLIFVQALSVGMNSSATSDLTATYDSAFESLGHDGGSRHSQNSVRSRPPGHIGHLSKEKANGICLSAFLNEENEVFSPHTVFYGSLYHVKF